MTQSLFLPLVLVALGGAVGGMARFLVSGAIARRIGEVFPWGTLTVNVTGAIGIGLLSAWLMREPVAAGPPTLWLVLVIGLLGSYTTVSSFSLQTLNLLRSGERLRALLNIVLSLSLCLAGVLLGIAAGTHLIGR